MFTLPRRTAAAFILILFAISVCEGKNLRENIQNNDSRQLKLSSIVQSIISFFKLRLQKDRLQPPENIVEAPKKETNGTLEKRNQQPIFPSLPNDSPTYAKPVSFEPMTLKDTGKIANIVGGNAAGPDEAQYFVMMLGFNEVTHNWEYTGCGGTLVSNRHILTAGHCSEGRLPSTLSVYVHAYQPFWGNPGVVFHHSKVESYTIHPSFDNKRNSNDVSIVAMEKPLNLGIFPPIKLAHPAVDVNNGDDVRVYGFGLLSESGPGFASTLQKADMTFYSRPNCQEIYSDSLTNVGADMVCAGVEGGGKDACKGDSGGPMIADIGNEVYQLGIISWGVGCGRREKPGVYSSVSYHYDWIQHIVCNDDQVDTTIDLCSKFFSGPQSESPALIQASQRPPVVVVNDSGSSSSPPSQRPTMTPSSGFVNSDRKKWKRKKKMMRLRSMSSE